MFFEQHYIFSERTGSFEKIPVGHCSLNGRKDCNGSNRCRIDSGISKVELYANQKLLFKEMERHMQWLDCALKDIYRKSDIPFTKEEDSPKED